MTQLLAAQVTARVQGYSCQWNLVDTVANLAAITTAGYLSPLQVAGEVFAAQDIFYISYVGGAGFFSPSFSGSVITLSAVPATPAFVSVAITADEFNGMYAVPNLLIAAPGANKLISVGSMVLSLTYGSAAFASGGVVAAQYDSTAHGAGVLATNSEAAADFFVTASTAFRFTGTSGNTVGALPFSTTVNKGLYLSNATGPFTTGTGSSLVANIYYTIITTA